MFTIAKRRTGRAIARRALFAPLDGVWNAGRPERSVEEVYEDRAELAAVLTARRRLSRADRDAMLLRIVGELPFEDIAVITRSTPAAVKMGFRARAGGLPQSADGRRWIVGPPPHAGVGNYIIVIPQ